MSVARKTTKSLGRPAGKDADKVKADLLQAARDHFLTREFKAASIRLIAQSAGVNGAMVNYYFGGKQGLYLAMVDDILELLASQMEELNKHNEFTVEGFCHSYCQMMAANPWWPNFMVREVLFSEGEVREAILQKFNVIFAPQLLQSIQEKISGGEFRDDLNPALALLSLMGMSIFPFLSKPVMEPILGIEVNEDTVSELAAHNTQLFLYGVAARPARGSGK